MKQNRNPATETEKELLHKEELLRITLNATADGILLVDNDGKISHMNRRFITMWNIPQHIVDTKDDKIVISYVLDQLSDPAGFLDKVEKLYNSQEEVFDEVGFKDGRVFERYTSPIMIDGIKYGRVWDFRDITERKKAEETIRQSETLLSSMFEASPAGIMLLVDRIPLKMNRAFCRITGYSQEEILGQSTRHLYFTEEEFNRVGKAYKEMDDEGLSMIETRFRRKDGLEMNTLICLSRANPSDEKAGFIAVCFDITGLKQAEEALRESEERLRSIINSIPIGMHIYHLESSGRLVFDGANPEADKLTGVNNTLFIGKTIEEAFPALVAHGVPAHYREAAGDGIPWHSEQIDYDENSIRGAFDVYAFQIGHNRMAAAFLDITRRKQAEEDLKNSEAVLRSLFNATPIGISLLVNRVPVKVNNSQCKILGYSEQEIIGQDARFVYTDEDEYNRVGRELYGQVEREGFGVIETHLKRKDGKIIEVLLFASPFDPGNISGGITLTMLDITGQRRMEAEKVHLEEMLLRSQKMEAIGTMAGGIAHDFNNILSGIFGYSELSLTVKDNPAETDRYLREILKASERARDLVSRILTFSRQSEPALKPVIPKYIINEALKLLRASTPTTVELKAVLKSDSAIMAEPTLLHQVILNLCNNAIYAMQSRPGVIEIGLEDMEVDLEFTRLHPDIKPGKHIMLRISDTGSGIAPEIIDRIFEPFFTTKPQSEGTGLGLSVVHGIVKKLNGVINVYSEMGKGTAFNIIIPVVKDEKIEIDRMDSIIKGGTETILLVDDEEAIIKVLSNILGHLGYKVKAFTDCIRALDEFRENPGGYDVIITDFSMPRMTGLEMTVNIRNIRKDIPVILNSGFLSKEMEENSLNAGVSLLLTKPVNTYQLDDALRKVLSGDKKS